MAHFTSHFEGKNGMGGRTNSAAQHSNPSGLYSSKHAPAYHHEVTPRFTPTVQTIHPEHSQLYGAPTPSLDPSYNAHGELPQSHGHFGGGDTQRASEQTGACSAWPAAAPFVPQDYTGTQDLQRYYSRYDSMALAKVERHSSDLARLFAETQAAHQFDLRKIEHKVDGLSASSTRHRADVDEELRSLQAQLTQMTLQMEKLEEHSALGVVPPASEMCQSKEDQHQASPLLPVIRDRLAMQHVEQNEAELQNTVFPVDDDAIQAQPAVTSNATSANAAPNVADATWQPIYIRSLPDANLAPRVQDNQERFTAKRIHSALKGTEWSPNFFVSRKNSAAHYPAYWLLDAETEPFIPTKPGDHGAKLTPFFNETLSKEAPTVEYYQHIPVFACVRDGTEYRYLGTYTAERFSDKVGYDVMMERLPEATPRHWAKYLSSKTRPEWVTQELIKHFWPMPRYDGPMPTDSAINTPATIASQASGASTEPVEKQVQRALNYLAEDLKVWDKDARVKASLITEETIMTAFRAADADAEPGLRLWWEYLQCVGYDEAFYQMLITSKSWNESPKGSTSGPKKVQAKKQTDTKTTSKASKGNEEPPKAPKHNESKRADAVKTALMLANSFSAVAVEGQNSQEDAWKQANEMVLPGGFSTSHAAAALKKPQHGQSNYYARQLSEADRQAAALQRGKFVAADKVVDASNSKGGPARGAADNYVPPHKRSGKDPSVSHVHEDKGDVLEHPGGEKHTNKKHGTTGAKGTEAGKRLLKGDLEAAKKFNDSATKAKERH